jgi:Mn2+/Fe2+ NRAMP family transporter
MLLTYPLMVTVQEISARLGRTTGLGIAGNLRLYHPRSALAIACLLFAANVCNIGADLGAMAAAAQLLFARLPTAASLLCWGVICAISPLLFSYARYLSVLRWLTISLFAYFGALLFAHTDWSALLHSLIWPTIGIRDKDAWLTLVAVLGTTISPYLFFWQASQEVEATRASRSRQPLRNSPRQALGALSRIRIDTRIGMAFSNVIGLAIITTAAATLHAHGVSSIESAPQAAEALRPIAGRFASALFALGILGTGLLSVPVLAGSAAYALGESRRWRVGLHRRPMQAKGFYATMVIATLVGMLANVSGISPMRALILSAVINALVAVPVMVFLMMMAADRRIMQRFVVKGASRAVGWLATAVMALASSAFLVSLILK